MKNLIPTILLAIFPLVSYSQKPNFSVYNNQINTVKEEVKYFEIEKINSQLLNAWMLSSVFLKSKM